MTTTKRPPGRPAGSGAQLAPVDRMRKSRTARTAAGSRLDVVLDAEHADMLAHLVEKGFGKTKKRVIERALAVVFSVLKSEER